MATDIETNLEGAETLLVKLAVLMADGQGESERAYTLRDQLADVEKTLGDAEIIYLRRLSSDLYALEDDEIYCSPACESAGQADLAQGIRDNAAHERWNDLLVLLRQETPFLPAAARAYLRARAYFELGHYAAAWAFYKNAAQKDASRTAYEYLALQAQVRWLPDDAMLAARAYLDDYATQPAASILAATVLLERHNEIAELPTAEIGHIARTLISALGVSANRRNVTRDVMSSGYLLLANCLVSLGDLDGASRVLRVVEQSDPDSSAIRVQRQEFERLAGQGHSIRSGILIDLPMAPLSDAGGTQHTETLEDNHVQQLIALAG
jgi:tetratricopeptide (TPR) repeat protein